MDKKTKKELDKEIKEIQKNTLIVSKRMQKLVGLKSPEEEEDEEGEEIDDYLNDVNEEEVSTILKKAEEEMKEEEEIKKKEKEEKKEEIDKSEQILKEELDRIDEEDKENKKKKKKKKKKEKKNKEKEDEEEEDDYEEYEEYKKWKKMRKMEKQRLKQENQNNNKNEDNININDNNIKDDNKNKKDINNIKKEENKEKNKKEDKKENIDINNDDNDNNNNNESKEPEYNFNINSIQNTDNNNTNKNINNNEDNFNINNTNINNNNNIQANNKPQQVIPKNVYDKISANDKKIVSDLLKTSNAKYHEGEMFLSMGKYNEALKCFKQAKVLYFGINKLVQTKKDAYPKEFRDIMTSKINDKLKLVHQSAKNCSTTMTQKRIDFNNNNNINTTNYNFDFNALNDNSKDNKINNKNVFKNNPNNNINNNNNNQNKPKSLHDKEEDAMDQKIMSEIMSKNPGVKFSDIIGMNEMKQTLYEIIVVPTIRPDLFTGIRTPQRGILLFGPPGTGKTMIAKAIASECGSTFFNISASSLTSKWVGESEKTVKSLFKIAYQKVPSIIFIDEIDSILSKRSESENEATKRLKTEFLIQFDGLGSNTSARLLVIAATNRPMDLDEALLRRLPKRVYCGPLDEDGRFEFIKKVINRVDTELSDEDIREIAKLTNDYSNSDLMELCREAAYLPVRELSNEEIMKLDKFRPINKNDMMKAVQKIRGTLSKKVRDELKRWNDQFGGV